MLPSLSSGSALSSFKRAIRPFQKPLSFSVTVFQPHTHARAANLKTVVDMPFN